MVGGGEVALRKIELLVGAGAHVTVVAPEVHAATAAFCEQHGVAVVRRRVREGPDAASAPDRERMRAGCQTDNCNSV